MADNYESDKDFTDRAWADMKTMLDKEMPDKAAFVIPPAASGNGKKMLLLLLLVFLLAALTAGILRMQNSSELPISTAVNESTLIDKENTDSMINQAEIAQESSKEAQSLSPEAQATNEAESVENEVQNMPVKSTLSVEKSGEITPTKTIKNSEDADLFIIENERNYLNNNPKSETTETTKSNEIAVNNATYLKETTNLDVVKEIAKSEETLLVPVTAVAFIETKNATFLTILEENALEKRKLDINSEGIKMSIGIMAGLRSYELNSKPNFFAGTEAIFRKSNSKFGLRSGLFYAQRSTSFLINEQTVSSFSRSNSSIIANGEEVEFMDIDAFDVEKDAIAGSDVKYHFLELSLAVDYEISSKWSALAGLQTSHLMYASYGDYGYLTAGIDEDTSALPMTPGVNSTESRDFPDVFTPNKMNFAAQVGLDFKVTTRLGLQARYSENLRDVYSNITGSQRSRFVEIGVKWQLK